MITFQLHDPCFGSCPLEPHKEMCVGLFERLTFVARLLRVTLGGMYITRPSVRVGRYKMIKHKLDKGNGVNPKRYGKQIDAFGFM